MKIVASFEHLQNAPSVRAFAIQRRRILQPGKPRTVPYLGDHIRQNVIGAVAPASGELFSLIVDGVDTEVFQFFLDEMARAVPRKEGVRQMLILDNASWHKSVRLHWHHFEPKFLPGYSPDFNLIERLWLRLKADWSWDFIARTAQELSDRLCLPSKASSTTRQNRLQLLSPEMTFENRSRACHALGRRKSCTRVQ